MNMSSTTVDDKAQLGSWDERRDEGHIPVCRDFPAALFLGNVVPVRYRGIWKE
jgi:hypothetical protein